MPATNRLTTKFDELKARNEKALICYVVTGYPNLRISESIIATLARSGADIIELGIPFSDPIADGPTIQEASFEAMKRGATPDLCLKVAKKIRARFPELPLVAMTYSNILIRPGLSDFMNRARRSGIDGFILPDMPVEESGQVKSIARELGLANIFLASPNTKEDRLASIVRSSSGFVYLVGVYGITGIRTSFEEYTFRAIRKVKHMSNGKIPVAVGFGISSPVHARYMINAGADGIIVGSAIIDIIRRNIAQKKMLSTLEKFIKSMKKECVPRSKSSLPKEY